jgi:hypothetical protein
VAPNWRGCDVAFGRGGTARCPPIPFWGREATPEAGTKRQICTTSRRARPGYSAILARARAYSMYIWKRIISALKHIRSHAGGVVCDRRGDRVTLAAVGCRLLTAASVVLVTAPARGN